MKQPWDTAMALCIVESSMLKLKKELCNGSMLKGYTAKALTEIDQDGVQLYLKHVQANVKRLAELIAE